MKFNTQHELSICCLWLLFTYVPLAKKNNTSILLNHIRDLRE